MTTRAPLALIRAASMRLAAGIAAFAAALWLAGETGGPAGRGLVFVGFAGFTMGLHAALKRLFPGPQEPRNTELGKT